VKITRICNCYHPDWMHNYYRPDVIFDCGYCRCEKFV